MGYFFKCTGFWYLALFCLFVTGCAADANTHWLVRQHFEQVMNRSVGSATYEEILTTFGPPASRQETAATITGIWEEPSMQRERVLMVFDRKGLRLKAWSYLPR